MKSFKEFLDETKLDKSFWNKMEQHLKKAGGLNVVVNPGYIQARFEDKAKADEIKKMFAKYNINIEITKDPGDQGYFVTYNS